MNCDRWTFSDYINPVPSGAIRGVGGTVMDLRIPQLLGNSMFKVSKTEILYTDRENQIIYIETIDNPENKNKFL